MMDTPLQGKIPAAPEMAETQLHKERLQALAEKRKRQAEIEDKREQLEDLVLQLQHLKSKAMRERWLLQGTPSGPAEEEDGRRRQLEQDEEQGRSLEDKIHRLESDIELLESEESQISAKEQVLRERLRETERSIEDLQKSLQNQDGDADSGELPNPGSCLIPGQTDALSAGDGQPPRKPAMFAMEISVEKDRRTGDTRILSAEPVSGERAAGSARGVKVFDDGRKVVYEVRSSAGGGGGVENGVHAWSSAQVDQLLRRVGQPARVTVTPDDGDDDDRDDPSSSSSSVAPPLLPPLEQTVQRDARLEAPPPPAVVVRQPARGEPLDEAAQEAVPEASVDHPVTMVFLGYQSVQDDEGRRLLGFDGAVKAEIVLIDEDDEKSLREKTVTDVSVVDGNAADLVSGARPLSDAATELSSEGRDPSSSSSPVDAPLAPPAPGRGQMTAGNGPMATSAKHTAMKAPRVTDDEGELRKDRAPKTVSFLDSVSVIAMEVEARHEGPRDYPRAHNGVASHEDSLDSQVAQEIRYLDQVLEANGCDSAAPEGPTNGTRSPVHVVDDARPSVDDVSAAAPPPATALTSPSVANGHSADSSPSPSSAAKREAPPPFELRPFQEERRPARLFESPARAEVRVTKVRASEEMLELERERLELIRGQAVKKNPGIASKWWNPPQERTLEEELPPEQLDSHRKYQQRKEQRREQAAPPEHAGVANLPSAVTFDLSESGPREDVVVEQIDFLSARKQFLQSEHARQGGGARRDVAPQLYSAKPFSVATGQRARSPLAGTGDTASDRSSPATESPEGHVTWEEDEEEEEEKGRVGEFTRAHAVMTILRDEDALRGSAPHLELDSGLDELSLRSQDTTAPETPPSADLSLDTASSDQEALSPPATPTPVADARTGEEEELEFRAGVLVHDAIRHALAEREVDPVPPAAANPSSSSSPLPAPPASPGPADAQRTEAASPSVAPSSPLPPQLSSSPPPPQLSPPSPAPKPSPGPERRASGGPRIRVQSSYARALAAAPPPAPVPCPAPTPVPAPSRPTQPYPAPPPSSPPGGGEPRQEFSYFSKYSEAAELRSTAAAARGPEAEPSAGPFRLRSRKQKTLSMIEEEIRAAQQREEELKRQRQTQLAARPAAPCHAPVGRQGAQGTTTAPPATAVAPGDKLKTNSLPAKLTLTTARTAPGKIEKIRLPPPVSPSSSSSEAPPASPLSDQGSDDSGGRGPKNYMQTLMEDYESHKVKRRDKQEDNSVLEATRVTRRKSNMALKWEAGIYANQGEGEDEEEEEEEEEE